MPRAKSVLVGEAEKAGHVLFAAQVKGESTQLVFCSRCGAYRQSVPRRLLHQRSGYRERRAQVRLRSICVGRHPTRVSLVKRVPWPLNLASHARRALFAGHTPYLVASGAVIGVPSGCDTVIPVPGAVSPRVCLALDESEGSLVGHSEFEAMCFKR